MTLHILVLDKFTKPFYHYIRDVLRLEDHEFIFLADVQENVSDWANVHFLKLPLRKYLYCNLKLFRELSRKADRIVIHGDTLMPFFAIFPGFLKKTGWVIYGQELYSLNQSQGFKQRLKKFVLSRVQYHITHIKGDSELANQLLHSNATFIYSPMYLSNVANTKNFKPVDISTKPKIKILVGNSTDPTNNHKGIFEKILKYKDDIETIYCPLSYGVYDDYKLEVTLLGKEMFGDKFVAIDKFMPFEEYKKLLSEMDVVIFDHNRQEAMGVTLTLLSLGKTVYMNPNTTSYESLIRRGFKVFNNNWITTEGLKVSREVGENLPRLQEYYSEKVFNESWIKISKL